jgi:hypothetical protein
MLHERTWHRDSEVSGTCLISGGKFADPEREIPDISGKFPVHQSREFAAKSLILRKYSETGSYVTACTTIQSSRTSQTVNDRKEAFFCGDLAACF